MEYRVRVWSAVQGNVVALVKVAEAMAKRAATLHGTLTLHEPTLKNLRPERVRLLWEAAMSGQLTVCDSHGRVASAAELIETASASVAVVAGAASSASMTAENALICLFARQKHLIEWGETSGDVFLFVETPGTLVNSDLRNFTEAGFGEVIEAGYWIGALGGGESEPWRDDLYDTAPCGTKPAQSSAATPAPVEGASDAPAKLRNQRPNLLTPLIQKAQRDEPDPFSAAVIWPKLCDMAELKTNPFIGKTESGLKWIDANDSFKYLTKEALADRLRRAKRAR